MKYKNVVKNIFNYEKGLLLNTHKKINTITCLTMISHKSGSAITAIASRKIFAFSSVYAWLSLTFIDVYKKKPTKNIDIVITLYSLLVSIFISFFSLVLLCSFSVNLQH